MPEEIVSEPQGNVAVVKSTHKQSPISKLREKLPQSNKKLILLFLIVLAIPVTIALALVQQDQRSRASGGDRKIFLGINNGFSNVDRPLDWIQADLERINAETGAYPAVYVLWANLESKMPDLEVLRFLDSKGVTPAISLMPRGKDGFDSRRDGRFILASSSLSDSVEQGKIKFNSSNPASITKIYVSKASTGTEDPAKTLLPTWINGETIEIFGSNSNNEIDYQSDKNFKFKIIANSIDAPNYWIINVSPIKTTPLVDMFGINKPVFITPSNYLVKKYSNVEIAKGSMDSKFEQIAGIAKQFNKPIIFRYAQEMNAGFYTWSDFHLKNKDKEGYKRYKFQDFGNNQGSFRSSWQHINGKMKAIAPNVLFFWNPHNSDIVLYDQYFPGDSYVDYVGFDAYSGSGTFNHNSLSNISLNAMSKLMSISDKPIIIGETGINSKHSNGVSGSFSNYRKDWLVNGYNDLFNKYPKLKGILYFDVDMTGIQPNNWLLSSNPEIKSAYGSLLLDPRFQGKLLENSSPTPTSARSTPTPKPTLPPPSPSSSPVESRSIGYHDSASCSVISGWACNPDKPNESIEVDIYADGPRDAGTFLGSTVANLNRESAVGAECGGVATHGFSFNTPDSLKNGEEHRIYAYAKDGSTDTRLYLTPKKLTCGASTVTPTPEPSGCIRNIPTFDFIDKVKTGSRQATVSYIVRIKNNDSATCKSRKLIFDLDVPTTRWTYTPESGDLAVNETKTISIKVTSGPYSTPGTKNMTLTVSGAYTDTIFATQILQYNVTQ